MPPKKKRGACANLKPMTSERRQKIARHGASTGKELRALRAFRGPCGNSIDDTNEQLGACRLPPSSEDGGGASSHGPDHKKTGAMGSAASISPLLSLRSATREQEALSAASTAVQDGVDEFRRDLAISEAVHGPDHEETGDAVYNLARRLWVKGELGEAEGLFRRALARTHPCRLRGPKSCARPCHIGTGRSIRCRKRAMMPPWRNLRSSSLRKRGSARRRPNLARRNRTVTTLQLRSR